MTVEETEIVMYSKIMDCTSIHRKYRNTAVHVKEPDEHNVKRLEDMKET